MKKFDYIICGNGCSGIMLAHSISRSAILSGKKVLLIDLKENTCQGHSFGFWSHNDTIYDKYSFASWAQINVADRDHTIPITNGGYQYRLIKGGELFRKITDELEQYPNFHFVHAKVLSVTDSTEGGVVTTNNGEYFGETIFNSIPPDFKEIELQKEYISMWQHFKAWEILTPNDCFDASTAILMDFRVEQDAITRFAHFLPYTKNKAFVEIISFDTKLHSQCNFDELLKDYILDKLKVDEYNISYTETGIIPMTEYPFKKMETAHIINLGMRSGTIKPSTGYGFNRTLSDIEKIVTSLELNENPAIKSSFPDQRFILYDNTLLDVLYNKRIGGSALFIDLFGKNKPELILKFLDEETNVFEELSIFCRVKIVSFVKAIIVSLIKTMKRKLQSLLKQKSIEPLAGRSAIPVTTMKINLMVQDN